MSFIGYYFLLLLCFYLQLINVKTQSDFDESIKDFIIEQSYDVLYVEPEMANSCYVKQLNASEDFYVMCPTMANCFIKQFAWNPSHSSLPPSNFITPCELIEENMPQLPVIKVHQLDSVLRALGASVTKMTTVCDSNVEFQTLQAVGVVGLNLQHLGCGNCLVDNVDEEAVDCAYNLKFLQIIKFKFAYLLNNSFCQFKQLEILSMIGCDTSWLEEDALVHLVHLKVLILNSNELTHLTQNLFRNNANLQFVDLGSNRIQFLGITVFHSLHSLKYLSLSDNRLPALNDLLTFPSNLETLSIFNNEIRTIGLELKNLPNLTKLEMGNNSMMEVDEGAFQNLSFLQAISLSWNKIKLLPENTFKNNLLLENLSLSWNQLMALPNIGHLYNLLVFEANGNQISSINKNDLVNCSRLSILDLSLNRVSFIEEGAFDNVRQLEQLNLSHNQLSQKNSNFKPSNIILELYLDYNNFTLFSFQYFPPSIQQLSIRFNEIKTIENFDVHKQRRWNLTNLDLSSNYLVSIEHLRLPYSVQFIDLNSNQITKLKPFSDKGRQLSSQLHTVDVRNNNIILLCENDFHIFNIGGDIKTINYYVSLNPLKCSCDLLWLKNSPQTLKTIKFMDLDDIYCREQLHPWSAHSKPLPSLTFHDLPCLTNQEKKNRCECPQHGEKMCEVQLCPYNCTCLSDFQFEFLHFMCNDRNFQQIPAQFSYAHVYNYSNIILHFSGNSFSHIEVINFSNLNMGIIILSLHSSEIEWIENIAFDRLFNLLTLDLSYNYLESLPRGLFHKLTKLAMLHLDNNNLLHLADDTFNSLNNLRMLNLHNNGLKHLEVKQITDKKLLTNVTLHENPWSCECEFIKSFKAFLVNSSTPIQHKLELNCTEDVENGREWNVVNFNLDHCYAQMQNTAVIVSLTFGLILLITVGLVFKWRYELQVLVYARYGLRVFHKRQTEVENKQYDAFMAYNSDDEEFLVQDLLPGLEAIERPYRLCIHHRDFPGGARIQDSILDAIDMSSRTIILLSENFVNSGWCRFEFKSAHMKMLEDRCPRILVILVGEVPETLDPEMKLYLKTNTYLKWGEKLFWQKLYYAMPDKRVTTPATDIMNMRVL